MSSESARPSEKTASHRCDDCRGTGLTAFTGAMQAQCPTCWGTGEPLTHTRRRLLSFAMLGQGFKP